MTKEMMTLVALGDLEIDRDEPETIFKDVVDVIRSADIAFANCDQVYTDKGHPNPIHATARDPKMMRGLVHAGLDVISLANNHSLDWGPEGLLDCMDRLRDAGIPVVGAGKNIAEARQPVILERKGNRIGFLAYGCIGPSGYEATEDRPGYAPMRAWTIYEQWEYQPGTPPRIVTLAYRDDLAAMEEDIRKLKAQVDVVAVSYHWGLHMVPALIPMYEFEIAHAAIDAGADIIFGGHPHILKGIEVYRGRVIFHSLSNFAVEIAPAIGKRHEKLLERLQEMYHYQPDPEYPTYPFHPEAKATLIAKAIIENGAIKRVSYLPCYVNKNAEPEIKTRNDPKGQEVAAYMERISRDQKLAVNFAWEGDEIVISD
jgi:poly-gamma-glutamate synthesis protein (capsule biosynthesis protein)